MNRIKETNLLSEYKSVRIKLARRLSIWSLLTLVGCLTLFSTATAQRADNQNQKLERQKLETLQKLRGNRLAMKNYLQKVENESFLNYPQKDFGSEGSAFSGNFQPDSPSNSASVDSGFNGNLSDGSTRVEAVAVQSDGKILFAGGGGDC